MVMCTLIHTKTHKISFRHDQLRVQYKTSVIRKNQALLLDKKRWSTTLSSVLGKRKWGNASGGQTDS